MKAKFAGNRNSFLLFRAVFQRIYIDTTTIIDQRPVFRLCVFVHLFVIAAQNCTKIMIEGLKFNTEKLIICFRTSGAEPEDTPRAEPEERHEMRETIFKFTATARRESCTAYSIRHMKYAVG
jgi:hypothetical protein